MNDKNKSSQPLKDFIQQNYIRIIYFIICLVILAVAFYLRAKFLDATSKNIDILSYYGIVITTIGLVITIFEVFHSIHISRSIQKEAQSILQQVKLIESASLVSDCLSSIDDVSKHIMRSEYEAAHQSFLYFRKVCAKLISFENQTNDNLNALSSLEIMLSKYVHSDPLRGISTAQRNKLTKDIQVIKQLLEKINPAKSNYHATT
jgi:hypothetical protein